VDDIAPRLDATVAAIGRHRRRTAELLAGLDELERATGPDGTIAIPAAGVDVSTLVSSLAGRLRLHDVRLERLAAELSGRTCSNRQNHRRQEIPHAHALRPLP